MDSAARLRPACCAHASQRWHLHQFGALAHFAARAFRKDADQPEPISRLELLAEVCNCPSVTASLAMPGSPPLIASET
jgi:hypothetical protein